MAHQLYRKTSLGNSLQESLDELIQNQRITPELAHGVLLRFDKSINSALAKRVNANRVVFKGRLRTYRSFEDSWIFYLKNADFREVHYLELVKHVKIITRDAKSGATG